MKNKLGRHSTRDIWQAGHYESPYIQGFMHVRPTKKQCLRAIIKKIQTVKLMDITADPHMCLPNESAENYKSWLPQYLPVTDKEQ